MDTQIQTVTDIIAEVSGIVAARTGTDQAELAQEAWVEVLPALDRYDATRATPKTKAPDARGPLKAYVAGIAKRVCYRAAIKLKSPVHLRVGHEARTFAGVSQFGGDATADALHGRRNAKPVPRSVTAALCGGEQAEVMMDTLRAVRTLRQVAASVGASHVAQAMLDQGTRYPCGLNKRDAAAARKIRAALANAQGTL